MTWKENFWWNLRYEAGRLGNILAHPIHSLAWSLTRATADKSLPARPRYNVKVSRSREDGRNNRRWWIAEIREYKIMTQGNSLRDALCMAEDLIRCHEECLAEQALEKQERKEIKGRAGQAGQAGQAEPG